MQISEKEGVLPDYLIACVGGGSNAIGLFHEFLDEDWKVPMPSLMQSSCLQCLKKKR